jgi:hypothetical protein
MVEEKVSMLFLHVDLSRLKSPANLLHLWPFFGRWNQILLYFLSGKVTTEMLHLYLLVTAATVKTLSSSKYNAALWERSGPARAQHTGDIRILMQAFETVLQELSCLQDQQNEATSS